jgi:ElaB/YqjD/DUF883 family membrane-anchored ribosome-binding protein
MATATSRTNGASKPNIKHALASVSDGVADVRHDVEQLATTVGAEVKARAGSLSRAAQETTSRAVEATRSQVRERPAAAMGVAAGAGLLLGLLLASRR